MDGSGIDFEDFEDGLDETDDFLEGEANTRGNKNRGLNGSAKSKYPDHIYGGISAIDVADIQHLETKAREYEQQALLHKKLRERCKAVENRLLESEKNLRLATEARKAQEAENNATKINGYGNGHVQEEGEGEEEALFCAADDLPTPASLVDGADEIYLGAEDDDDDNSEDEGVPVDFVGDTDFESSIRSGVAAFGRAEYELARCHFTVALGHAKAEGEERSEARAEGNLANVYSTLYRPAKAMKHFHRALKLLRKLKEKRLEAFILSNGVVCSIQLGQYDEAMGYALRKLAISTDRGEKKEAEAWIDKVNQAINQEVSLVFQKPELLPQEAEE